MPTPYEKAVLFAIKQGLVKSADEVDQSKSRVMVDAIVLFNSQNEELARFSRRQINSFHDFESEESIVGDSRGQQALLDSGGDPKKRFEYKFVRVDLKGRGITLEINLLDIDGKRVSSWTDDKGYTLPALLGKFGSQGWEMVNHTVNQDNRSNGVTLHYFSFKREI